MSKELGMLSACHILHLSQLSEVNQFFLKLKLRESHHLKCVEILLFDMALNRRRQITVCCL